MARIKPFTPIAPLLLEPASINNLYDDPPMVEVLIPTLPLDEIVKIEEFVLEEILNKLPDEILEAIERAPPELIPPEPTTIALRTNKSFPISEFSHTVRSFVAIFPISADEIFAPLISMIAKLFETIEAT